MDKILRLAVYLIDIPVILIVITIHEFTKAVVSNALCDNMPKNDGRLTLNPFKHFDWLGFFMILFWGYGWGKPVRTSSLFYKNKKKDTILVYTAPMLALVLLSVLSLICIKFFGSVNYILYLFLVQLAIVSLKIAIFNIIPIYPMDGSKILSVCLNPNQAMQWAQMEGVLQVLLLFLIMLNWGVSILNSVFTAVFSFLCLLLNIA